MSTLTTHTTASRDSHSEGLCKFNNTNKAIEVSDGTDWLIYLPDILVDYLVVAGGGGGAALFGGGGAGGYRTSYGDSSVSELSLKQAINYTVTVGAGGAGTIATQASADGGSGFSSIFGVITSAGGG